MVLITSHMGKKRTAVLDVVTPEEYRDMLHVAARIDDREFAIECFFLLVMLFRVGLRVGEAIHMKEDWYKKDIDRLIIPDHDPCDCLYCEKHARNAKYLDSDDYWRAKEGGRKAIVYTDQQHAITQRYFGERDFEMTYKVAHDRLKRIAELTDGINPETIYPHVGRATATTHLLKAGVPEESLDAMMGWEDPQTKSRYIKLTAIDAERDLNEVLGRDVDKPTYIKRDPDTFEEIREQNELIELNGRTPDSADTDNIPTTRDPEEQMKLKDIADKIDSESDDRLPVGTPIGATAAVAHDSAKSVAERASKERRAMAANSDVADLTPSHVASVLVGCLLLSMAVAVGFADMPTQTTLGLALGSCWSVWDIDI
jgi:site-specific recombinase XerD